MGKYISTKIFDNYSVALRQHKAQHSHCHLLHGYAFKFKVWFTSDSLDEMNWVMDFGGFKSQPEGNGLKDWMNHMFDHTLLVEKDDPMRAIFEEMPGFHMAKVHFMEKMGAESMAELVFNKFNDVLSKTGGGRVSVCKVECFENDKNSGIFEG